ncbi:sulfatase [bacterium]|nr:sulfatase [bacterium]
MRISIQQVVATIAVLGLGCLSTHICVGGNLPNILYINADDHGVMDVGYNNPIFNTPNLDRLRSEGMLFTEAYAPAANCAPSRACVLSGQWGPRHGVYTVTNSDRGKAKDRKIIPTKNTQHLGLENLTIPAALQAGGYKTIHLGKWHIGEDPVEQGIDINVGGDRTGSPKGGYFAPFNEGSMERFDNEYPKGTHRVDIFADQAIRFLRESGDQPFFMHLAFYAVHTPIQPVKEFVANYEGKDVSAGYGSMVEKMDQGIGKILDELDTLGLRENTLIVFCSDNGGIRKLSKQDPYRSGKGSYFEGGIRVPLLVSWKGRVEPNSSCATPVSGIDFFPTLLEAAGLSEPEGKQLDGKSLLPLLEQREGFPERALFWHFPVYLQKYAGKGDDSHDPLFRTRPGSVVRMGKWKLHEYFEDGRLELYDLDNDTGERKNVAASHPEQAARLYRLLKDWRSEIEAPVPTEQNPKYQGK